MATSNVNVVTYYICIHYQDRIYFEGYVRLPEGSDPRETIKNDLKKLRQKKNIDIRLEKFSINARKMNWMELFPIFEAVRYCADCHLDSQKAGVTDDQFVHCGRCGKRTSWDIRKAKKGIG